jgi:hypothetical protein
MTILDANISPNVADYLKILLATVVTCEKANQAIFEAFGIVDFISNDEELAALQAALAAPTNNQESPDRAAYGDFQTNPELANKAVLHLAAKKISPEIVIEPTCGKGSFILASLRHFSNLQFIYGIEIYLPYVWEAKFNIIDFYLSNPRTNKPTITIAHCSVFDFDFNGIAQAHTKHEILVIGNPPWVTNATLSSLSSSNLPNKTNFKHHKGLDAMTGKGNFDIAESITLTMIDAFQHMKGHLLLLVKNSVIKNLVFDQHKNRYPIASIEKHCIDSKQEFNASVEAALFFCRFDSGPAFECTEYNFYNNQNSSLKFGWQNDKFVSNMVKYTHSTAIDGVCPFIWRQGIKHDCSSVMELSRINGHYVNGLKEAVQLEDGLVYGLLKSSDLKNAVIHQTRKFTIVTQQKVGQDTNYIQSEYPNTYQYLNSHRAIFEARKSSIYRNKPAFSIFGIGDYSFKPYKVAISGLYKTFHFSLILPQGNKPVMLDDTCYCIGFDSLEYAAYTLILLNSKATAQLLQSITFPDAKRTFTKEVLMRIDLLTLARQIVITDLQTALDALNAQHGFNLALDLWHGFIETMTHLQNRQMGMVG